jgi:hypothetical protein
LTQFYQGELAHRFVKRLIAGQTKISPSSKWQGMNAATHAFGVHMKLLLHPVIDMLIMFNSQKVILFLTLAMTNTTI